jgi:hypothetical protein
MRLVEQSHKNFADGFGGKTIDTKGTMALLINNVTGFRQFVFLFSRNEAKSDAPR